MGVPVTVPELVDIVDLGGRLVVAGAFAWAAVAKLADLPGLRSTLYLSRLTRPWVPQLTVMLPAVELGLAALLVTTRPAWLTAVGAAVLLSAFTVFLATDPHAGQGCNCFGRHTRASGSSRRAGIVRDLLLLVAVAPAVVRGPKAVRPGVAPGLEVAFALVAAGLVAGGIALAVRRDRISRRATGRRRAGTPPVQPPPVVRVEAPVFDVPALDGSRLRLAPDGVLLFVEPGCDLCAAVLPEAADRPDVVVLVAGKPVEAAGLAERYRLDAARVGVDEDGAVADAYAVPGTPAACRVGAEGVLVDAAGRPAARPAVGVDAVRALLCRQDE